MSRRTWEELARNTEDHAASDFHDDQSTFSHVTYATLPPYEFVRSSPPPLPISYGTHTHSASSPQHQLQQTHLRTQASSRSMDSISSRSSVQQPVPAEDDEFHGFRPRSRDHPATVPVLSGQWAPQPATSPYQSFSFTPGPTTAAPAYRPHQPQAFVAFPTTTSYIQPQSYVIGPYGQPIPVYASAFPVAASPAYYSQPPPLQAVPRAPLANHSQPLEFNHTLPYSPSTLRTTAPPIVQPAGPPATVPSYTSYHPASASHPLPTHSARAAVSVTPPSFSYPRPPSAASNDSGNSATTTLSTSATALRSRVMSLRAKLTSPHVRFKSPEPGSVGPGPAARMRAPVCVCLFPCMQ
ncbi:hypothetical protein JCM1841_003930 [Sporobolomyces salmonicolor]